MEGISTTLSEMLPALAWAPPALVALALAALAVIAALLLHALIVAVFRRLLRHRYPYLRSLLVETKNPARAALLIVAMFIVLPLLPIAPETRAFIARLLLIAVIIVIGWTALIALRLASDVYLRRFRSDVADDLIVRKHQTQVRILHRSAATLVVIATVGAALMTFDAVREFGVSLFASAGVAGLVVGLAARPMLSNLIAGVQLAVTQPIRLGDTVIVENESGRVEEITSTYVLIRLWNGGKLVVPLNYFIERPFQNRTAEGAALIGTAVLLLTYAAPVERIRAKAKELAAQSPLWDGGLLKVQLTSSRPEGIEVRILAGARSAGDAFDLGCELSEKLIAWLNSEIPEAIRR
jgi:small-conductance mechanosensitive channel